MYIVVLSRLHIEMAILKVSECMHLHKLCNMHFVHRYDIGWIKVGRVMLLYRVVFQVLVQQILSLVLVMLLRPGKLTKPLLYTITLVSIICMMSENKIG